jgi:hypothetical protein
MSSKAKGKRKAETQHPSENLADPEATDDGDINDEVEAIPLTTPRRSKRSGRGADDSKYVPNPDGDGESDTDVEAGPEGTGKDGLSDGSTEIIPFDQPRTLSSVKKRRIRSSIADEGNTKAWSLDGHGDDAGDAGLGSGSPSIGRRRNAKRRAVEDKSEPDVPIVGATDEPDTQEDQSGSGQEPSTHTQAPRRSWFSYVYNPWGSR